MENPRSYRYDLILPNGRLTEWTGIFESLILAHNWYANWGKFWEGRGHKLKLVETGRRKQKKGKSVSLGQTQEK